MDTIPEDVFMFWWESLQEAMVACATAPGSQKYLVPYAARGVRLLHIWIWVIERPTLCALLAQIAAVQPAVRRYRRSLSSAFRTMACFKRGLMYRKLHSAVVFEVGVILVIVCSLDIKEFAPA